MLIVTAEGIPVSRSTIGLDIATTSVRAAELSVKNGEFQLGHFGQVPLPVGAVVDGEVREVPVVGEAIKTLWQKGKFSSKDVSIGVASQRVVVRQIDIPYLPPSERKDGLPMLVADQIPMSIDEAVLDYVHLGSVPAVDTPDQLSRGLLVAATESVVTASVEAAEYAGLRVRDVDLTPFALVRSLGSTSAAQMSGVSEAIVDIGAATTVLAIHQDGIPHFVRILLQGGQDISDRLIAEMDVDLATAEALKRETGMLTPGQGRGPGGVDAPTIITEVTETLVDEIRGSIDYFSATSDRTSISRILLTGGGSLSQGLLEALREATGIQVDRGLALAALGSGRSGLSPDHVAFADPMSAACVGLAVREDV